MPIPTLIILGVSIAILSCITGWAICAYQCRQIWDDGFRAAWRGATVETSDRHSWYPGKPQGVSHNTPGSNPGPWHPDDAPLVIRLDEAGNWQATPPEELQAAREAATNAGAILWATVIALAVVLGLTLFAKHIFDVETRAAKARAEASAYPTP